METKTILIIFAIITVAVGVIIISVGCSMEKLSVEEFCAGAVDAKNPATAYPICVQKQEDKWFACDNWFNWMKY